MNDLLLPITGETLLTATAMFAGFFGALFVGAMLLPGLHRKGFPTPAGERLDYKLTGLALFLLTSAALVVWTVALGKSLTPVLSHFWPLFVIANVFSVGFTLWLWARGRAEIATRPPEPLWKILWMGPQLNPRLLGVDLKMFFYQPSLIGLFVFVYAFAARQAEVYGALTPQMMCFVGFWWVYLFTHYIKEAFMLSTWDIIAERFGFMLVWGDIAYVPFFYCIAGFWLIDDQTAWPAWALALLIAVHLFGHVMFRTANWQKDRYKRDRDAKIWGKPAETIDGRLLVSGWWGIGRKLNYTGEIIVYLTITATVGFQSPWPWLLPAWLIGLLVQRAFRDDKKCREKYGELWQRYCARARFRMVPFLF